MQSLLMEELSATGGLRCKFQVEALLGLTWTLFDRSLGQHRRAGRGRFRGPRHAYVHVRLWVIEISISATRNDVLVKSQNKTRRGRFRGPRHAYVHVRLWVIEISISATRNDVLVKSQNKTRKRLASVLNLESLTAPTSLLCTSTRHFYTSTLLHFTSTLHFYTSLLPFNPLLRPQFTSHLNSTLQSTSAASVHFSPHSILPFNPLLRPQFTSTLQSTSAALVHFYTSLLQLNPLLRPQFTSTPHFYTSAALVHFYTSLLHFNSLHLSIRVYYINPDIS
jgi:hypothetical protein